MLTNLTVELRGHGKVIADLALSAGWDTITFFDDEWPFAQFKGSWVVEGKTEDLIRRQAEFTGVIVGIGDCKVRLSKHGELDKNGIIPTTLVHPRAFVSSRSKLGPGTVVMAGAAVNLDVVMGRSCIINTGSTVDHDCRLGDAVHVSPGVNISGAVTVGNCSWIGTGAVIKNGIAIGDNVIVGAGSVVLKSVNDSLVVIGNPSRPIH